MSALFSPLKIREVTFPNRIAVSPMCEYSSVDGFANDWHLVHLGSRAVGGAGLVLTEAAAVDPAGRITHADLGIWSDSHVPFLSRITEFLHSQGAVAGIQLAHAGRKASCDLPWLGGAVIVSSSPNGWRPVGPSAIAFNETDAPPHELAIDEIANLVQSFAAATCRSLAAGFDVVEIHAAHGYLMHEFLSPLANHRMDRYGGSFDNRIRFTLEVVEAVRKEWPATQPLLLRISATDWVEGGWTADDSVELARRVAKLGVDLVDCSSGALVPYAKIPAAPGFQVPFAHRVRSEAGVASGAVGLITSAAQAEAIIRDGQADLVLMAREMLRDPYFPMHAAKELGVTVHAPKQYVRAFHGALIREVG